MGISDSRYHPRREPEIRVSAAPRAAQKRSRHEDRLFCVSGVLRSFADLGTERDNVAASTLDERRGFARSRERVIVYVDLDGSLQHSCDAAQSVSHHDQCDDKDEFHRPSSSAMRRTLKQSVLNVSIVERLVPRIPASASAASIVATVATSGYASIVALRM